MAEQGTSERRAYQASGIAHSTLRYRRIASDVSGVVTLIRPHMVLDSPVEYRVELHPNSTSNYIGNSRELQVRPGTATQLPAGATIETF